MRARETLMWLHCFFRVLFIIFFGWTIFGHACNLLSWDWNQCKWKQMSRFWYLISIISKIIEPLYPNHYIIILSVIRLVIINQQNRMRKQCSHKHWSQNWPIKVLSSGQSSANYLHCVWILRHKPEAFSIDYNKRYFLSDNTGTV